MVTIVKHEWHQCDVQYAIELDEELLSEIYPDLDEDEIAALLQRIEDGEEDIEDIINEAWNNDIDIDWDHVYDDMWTMSKGGYDVTYELGDEDSWHHEPEPDPPTHKCTNCKWEGSEYDADWQWQDKDGNKRYTTEIIASNVRMLESKGGTRPDETAAPYDALPPFPDTESMNEDDVPF